MIHYENLQIYLRLRLKLKNYIPYWNLINHNGQWFKVDIEFNTQKRIEARKKKKKKNEGKKRNGNKDGTALYIIR